MDAPSTELTVPTFATMAYEEVTRAADEYVVRQMAAYRVDALRAIYDLAMMDVGEGPAKNQVKLMAAKMLAFPDGQMPATDAGIGDVLRSLNDRYHKDAPRIKSVRERVVTFEEQP